MKKALLLGTFGQTNLGDDLLMYNSILLLKNRGFNKILVNIATKENLPVEVARDFSDILELFETYNTSKLMLFKQLFEVDAVVYGGGSIFKDLYSTTGRGKHDVVLRIMLFNCAAWILRKPVVNLCIGIGYINSTLGRFFTKVSILTSRITFFRDEESYLYAKNILNISDKKISRSTDGIFINNNWGEPTNDISIEKKSDKKTVGINLLSDIPDSVDRNTYIQEITDYINFLMESGNDIIFIPYQISFNKNNDLVFIKNEIIPKLKGKNYSVLEDIVISDLENVHKKLDLFIGMRFHSLLISSLFYTPFIAIEYDPKCTRLMKEMNYDFHILLEDLSSEKMKSIQKDLENTNKEEVRSHLTKYIENQKDIIKRTISQLPI